MSSSYNIRGIPVFFPFEPYELQKQYMDKVIQCLQNSENGILESPTGTGKTLSLLCSTLAWLAVKKTQVKETLLNAAYNDEFRLDDDGSLGADGNSMHTKDSLEALAVVPKIIYSSRTHAQLSQAMQELKRTAYCDVRSTVLGGRDQLCIHPDVMQEKSNSVKGNLCGLKVKQRSCQFHNRAENKIKISTSIKTIMDIEDLVLSGKKERFCPYYMARDLSKCADIIFMPYNYLLDAKVRKSFGINLTNCVVIFDEAHNIERICEESASIQLKKSDILLGIDEVQNVMDLISGVKNSAYLDMEQLEKLHGMNIQNLINLKHTLVKFANDLNAICLKDVAKGITFPGDYIYEILTRCNITYDNKNKIMNTSDLVIQFLSSLPSGPKQYRGIGLSKLLDLLNLTFAESGNAFKPIGPEQQKTFIQKVNKCYKVHVNQIKKDGNTNNHFGVSNFQQDKYDRALNFWCFSPGFGMNMLLEQKPKCIILTSGTLAPLRPLISELELNIDVRLENPHIVNSNQVCVNVVDKGPDSQILSSSYSNRQNPNCIASLGRTILSICRFIPGGLLIFFPSYTVMNLCQNAWQKDGLWTSISNFKTIFVEPRDKDEFRQNMKDYYECINDPKYAGAIFMGVCRGKVSEGLDFADANGRGVIITGLPFPPLMDPKVILKREYMDQCRKVDKEFLSGSEWYQLEASRAVNQAIGRVIRHRNDYGIIILADSRFTDGNIRANLSKWLQNRIQIVPNFGNLVGTIRDFFKNASKNYPVQVEVPPEPDEPINTEEEEPQTEEEKEPQTLAFIKPIQDSNTTDDDDNDDNLSSSSVEYIPTSSVQDPVMKRRKVTIEPHVPDKTSPNAKTDKMDFIFMLRDNLNYKDTIKMANALTDYRKKSVLEPLIACIKETFTENVTNRHILNFIFPYLCSSHVEKFNVFWENFKRL